MGEFTEDQSNLTASIEEAGDPDFDSEATAREAGFVREKLPN